MLVVFSSSFLAHPYHPNDTTSSPRAARQEYFDSVYQYCYERPYRLAWDMKVPVEQLQMLLSRPYLLPELYVGVDARFIFGPLLALPLWCSEHLVRLGNLGMRDPAFVTEAKRKKSVK
jgi:hypothetical protein